MNRAKTSYRNRLLSFPKIFITGFLFFNLLLFANLALAQIPNHNNPKKDQWKSVGGKIVASGTHHFTNYWLLGDNGMWWKNDENRNNPATHTRDEVTKDVVIRKGQFTVRGPGFLAKFQKRIKGTAVGAGLKFAKSGKNFWTAFLGGQDLLKASDGNWKWYDDTIVDFDPASANNGGWVPAGKQLTFDVLVYNNQSGIGYTQYGAPIGVDYEFWFFPREGGEVIQYSKILKKDKVALGYIMSIIGDKDGTIERLKSENDISGEKLKKGDVIYDNDILITHDVMVKMIFNYYSDRPLVVMKQNTKIKLEIKKKIQAGGIFAVWGKLFFRGLGVDHRGFKIVTSNAITGIEGTKLETAYDPVTGKTTVTVWEGVVSLKCKNNDSPPIMVNAGMQATMNNDCNHTLAALGPDNNTPAKAGWGTDISADFSNSQDTARLLTASSNRDMVGRNENFRGDGKTDAIFRAQFSAPNRTVTAVEVSNTNGIRSVWDTRPNNRLWLGAVVIGGRTMSRSDGSVNFTLGSGQSILDFFVQDNGSIRGGKTNYRMTIFFASGDPLRMDVTRGP